MKPKRLGGLVLAGLLYGQAALGLVAMGVMTQPERNIVVGEAGYGLTAPAGVARR